MQDLSGLLCIQAKLSGDECYKNTLRKGEGKGQDWSCELHCSIPRSADFKDSIHRKTTPLWGRRTDVQSVQERADQKGTGLRER